MKKIRLKIFFVLLLFATSLAYVSAQPSPEPSGGPESGQPLPVGNGMLILAGLAAAYGAGKVFIMKKKQQK